MRLADAAEDGAADHAGALAHRLGDEVLLVEAERGGVGRRQRGREAELGGAAGGLGVRALRVGEQALLGRRSRPSRREAARRCLTGACFCGAARLLALAGGRLGRRGGALRRLVELELAADLRALGRALLGRRVGLGDLAEVRVGVGVAVDVEQLHEAAEALAAADPDDLAVVDGDRRGALAGEDVDPAAVAVGLDDHGGVGAAGGSCASGRPSRACRRRSPWRGPGSGPGSGPSASRRGRSGRPPMTRARSSTESTYQSAWL